MNILNPYSYIVGGLAVLSVGATIYYQSLQIHHFHSLYDGDENKIAVLNQKITDMTQAQNEQTLKSEGNVIKVVQGPREVQSIIREVQSAPASGACPVPTYPKEVTSAF